MANKNDLLSDELKAAEINLKNLQAQRDDLSQKICDFEFQLSKLDLSDTSAAIEVVQNINQSLEAHHAILERINNEIPAATHRVDVAQKKVNEAASELLRKDEITAYKEAVQKLIDLEKALSKLGQMHKSLWNKYKVPARCSFQGRLIIDVAGSIETIKHTQPELLGLPPLKTPEQKRRWEAEYNVKRMRERLTTLEGYTRDQRSVDWDKVLKSARQDLKIAEESLAAL
jgi:hypothetical protein